MFRLNIYLDFNFYVCWQTKIKTCLEYVLDIARDSTSQVSKKFKLQEEELRFYEARPIENQARSIENCKYDFSAKFQFSPNIAKAFRVLSETLLGIKGKP